MRLVIGIIVGILAAFATVMLIEVIGHLLFPFPSDIDLTDPEQARGAMERIPFGAKLMVVFAWLDGAIVGGLIARIISRRRFTAWVVAGVVTVAGIANIFMIPHPVWMQIAAVAAPLIGGLVAAHVPLRPRPQDTAEPAQDA